MSDDESTSDPEAQSNEGSTVLKGPRASEVIDAIDGIIAKMTDDDRRRFIKMDPFTAHFGWGLGLRNGLSLWHIDPKERTEFLRTLWQRNRAFFENQGYDLDRIECLIGWPADSLSDLIRRYIDWHSRDILGLAQPEPFSILRPPKPPSKA